MRLKSRRGLLALALASGCGGGRVTTANAPTTQRFSREVNATSARVVASTVKVFGQYSIPVAVADEPSGVVRSLPVNLRGNLTLGTPEDRVTCTNPAADTLGAVMVVFQVNVKRSDSRSVIELEVQRDDRNKACVVRSALVTSLLDEIVSATGTS